MEKFNIGYSTKNIPLPSQNDFLQRLIEKTEQFLRRMRWKAYFFLNPDTSTSSKDTYGFKSTKNPPPIDELKDFEDDMLKMVQSTKFKQVNVRRPKSVDARTIDPRKDLQVYCTANKCNSTKKRERVTLK